MLDSSLNISSNILNTINNKKKLNIKKQQYNINKKDENKFLIDKQYSKTWINNYFKK